MAEGLRRRALEIAALHALGEAADAAALAFGEPNAITSGLLELLRGASVDFSRRQAEADKPVAST